MDSSRKQALVVLGMHRSGTSALSRCLSFLGYSQPSDLMPAREDNPKGFWEAVSIVRLNDRILADLDTSWARPGLFRMPGKAPLESAVEVDAVIAARYLEDAVAALQMSYGEESRIVVKDPRIALFPLLWNRALEETGFAPRYVLIFRNPLEVAASLNARNRITRPGGSQLWLRYNLSALSLAERDQLEEVVSFADLLAGKGGVIRQLADAFGIEVPSFDERDPDLVDFLDPGGRHQLAKDETVFRSPMLPMLTKDAYRLCLGWRDLEPTARNEMISQLAVRFEEFCLLAGSLVAVPQDLAPAVPSARSPVPAAPALPKGTAGEGGERTVIIHYHFFKNAGTSIDAILRKNFGSRWVQQEYMKYSRAEMPSVALSYILENRDLIVLSSHSLLLPTPTAVGLKVLPIVFIRHPLDRLKSAYVFERRQMSETEGARLAKEADFAGYLDARLAMPGDRFCRNFQTHRLAMADPGAGTEFERASRVVDRLPFVGLVEAFDQAIEELERFLREYFPDFRAFQVHANTSQRTENGIEERVAEMRTELGDDLFATIEAANSDDLKLYARVAQKYQVLASKVEMRSPEPVEISTWRIHVA